ncbi:MAG: hypothetical protein C4518_07390 [Desulfobacteraceae bacterium]|nr:MAG: hypothetical protein C4518_07390 [Desulfobacteraceae bacterium]
MTKEEFTKKIIKFECWGFLIIIVILWLDEILDIPAVVFGGQATPINYTESLFETVLVVGLATLVMIMTRQLLERIQYLEGILPVCMFCKKIRKEDQWVPIENYIRDHSAAEFSHSLCPDCREEHYGYLKGSKEKITGPMETISKF